MLIYTSACKDNLILWMQHGKQSTTSPNDIYMSMSMNMVHVNFLDLHKCDYWQSSFSPAWEEKSNPIRYYLVGWRGPINVLSHSCPYGHTKRLPIQPGFSCPVNASKTTCTCKNVYVCIYMKHQQLPFGSIQLHLSSIFWKCWWTKLYKMVFLNWLSMVIDDFQWDRESLPISFSVPRPWDKYHNGSCCL